MVRDVVPMGEGLYRVAYKGCDHGHIVSGYAYLRSAPTSCPRCAMEATAKVSMDPAQMVRDEWKRIACLFVRHFYPEKYDQLVSEARGRARNQEKPDHHLAGVSDACESVGVALHVLRGVR